MKDVEWTEVAEVESWPVSIFIAGDVRRIRDICRKYCDDLGFCVTVTQTDYVYTGGMEHGAIVGLINYPRFPSNPREIQAHAYRLGQKLLRQLNQDSFSIQTPRTTTWYSRRK